MSEMPYNKRMQPDAGKADAADARRSSDILVRGTGMADEPLSLFVSARCIAVRSCPSPVE